MTSGLPTARLRAIYPAQIHDFLRGNDWIEVGRVPEISTLWRSSMDSDATAVRVPLRSELPDFEDAVAHVIEVLRRVSGFSSVDVLSAIEATYDDAFEIVLQTNRHDLDRVPIASMVGEFASFRAATLWSAVAATSNLPKKRVFTARPAKAVSVADATHAGHTKSGSFILTCLSPIIASSGARLLDGSPEDWPEARETTKLLFTCLKRGKQAAEQKKKSDQGAAFREAVAVGLSANLCEAFSRMAQLAPNEEVVVRPRWSPFKRAPEGLDGEVHLTRRVSVAMAEVARSYRSEAVSSERRIQAYPIELRRDKLPGVPGEVRFSAQVEGKLRTISAVLEDADYEKALDANSRRKNLWIKGSFESVGNELVLQSAESIEVEDD